MLRQSDRRRASSAAIAFALIAGLTACGIKGPLRAAPKSAAAPAASRPIENPATPPATTSPALPPPSTPPATR